ncbi:hypothetical protein M0R19_04235 [Candidatus Pacearchaeota archaeon]|nr:hypothetical protein [Candidatus Pacearchaeota archaeon]
MKKSELKKILKPIIEECVNEMLFDGLLSKVITEVFKGFSDKEFLVEKKQASPVKTPKRLNLMGMNMNNLVVEEKLKSFKEKGMGQMFEGTVPLSPVKSPVELKQNEIFGRTPLSDVNPNDPGVDLKAFGL